MTPHDLTHNTSFIIPAGTRILVLDSAPDGLPYEAVTQSDIRKFSTVNTVLVDSAVAARWAAHAAESQLGE
jgi:hypothetical protein